MGTLDDITTTVQEQPSYMYAPWGGIGGKKSRVAAKRDREQGIDPAVPAPEPTKPITPPSDIQGVIDLLNGSKAKQDEDLGRREERLKRAKVFTQIGDAMSAFSNAYKQAQGVQVPSTPSLSSRWQERYDAIQRERLANDIAYYQAAERAKNAERTANYQARSLDLREKEEERRQIQLNNATRKQDWLEKYQQGTLDIKKEQMEIEREYRSGQISKMERDAASNELRAQAAMLRAQKATDGGGRVGGYTTNTEIHRDERGRETGRTTTRIPAGGKPVTTTTTKAPEQPKQANKPSNKTSNKPSSNNHQTTKTKTKTKTQI